jgi:quercetin dioxygenase-like cupin family protein
VNHIKHVPAESSQAYLVFGRIFRFLVSSEESGGSYATMEVRVGPHSGPDSHIHEDAEEQFYVLEGDLTVKVGDQTFEVSPGDFIHIPRGTTHSFKNKDTNARLLATFSPGAEGDIFVKAGQPVNEDEVARHFGRASVKND